MVEYLICSKKIYLTSIILILSYILSENEKLKKNETLFRINSTIRRICMYKQFKVYC